MPVTTRPSPERTGRYDPWAIIMQSGREGTEVSSEDPVLQVVKNMTNKVKSPWSDAQRRGFNIPDRHNSVPILASSMEPWTETDHVVLHKNGFIDTVNEAFANDLHLILRPDDVWLAIMTQFNAYVNGRPEELRHLFVKHEGQIELMIHYTSSWTFAEFTQSMTAKMQKHIVNPDMESWMIPSFSTTTDSDRVILSFAMMSSMKSYFGYGAVISLCGFPAVTLLGEKADWEDIEKRISLLDAFGEEPAEWSKLLTVCLRYMIRTFDEPEAPEVKDFWMRASHLKGSGGSGLSFYSGWISAFAFWNDKGERLKDYSPPGTGNHNSKLTLDGLTFPIRDQSQIPVSVVSVPITITGDAIEEMKCTAMAGTVGMKLTEDKTQAQPFPVWCVIVESREPPRQQSQRAKDVGSSE